MAVVAAIVLSAAGCASGDRTTGGDIAAGAATGASAGQNGSASGTQDSGSGTSGSGKSGASGSAASDTTAPSTATGAATAEPSASGGSGSTPEPGVYPAVELAQFQSPSGNIACAIVDDGSTTPSVRCDIMDHTFTPPPKPPGGCGATGYGNSIVLSSGAPAQFICAGDTVYDPSAPVLEYDTTSVVGQFSCDSRTDGMVCLDLDSGHWFRIARATYTLA